MTFASLQRVQQRTEAAPDVRRPSRLRTPDAAVAAQAVARGVIQPQLRVEAVNDPLEYEADQIADWFLRMPDPKTPPVQHHLAGRHTDEERRLQPVEQWKLDEDLTQVQFKAGARRGHRLDHSTAAAVASQRGHGQPLPSGARRFFESRFGTSLALVKVHADAAAAELATRLNARAFTVGRDIFFAAGEYAPITQRGRLLLAHELTHVLQQETTQRPATQPRRSNVTRRQRPVGNQIQIILPLGGSIRSWRAPVESGPPSRAQTGLPGLSVLDHSHDGKRSAVSLLAATPGPAVQRTPDKGSGRARKRDLTGIVVLNGTEERTPVQVRTTREIIPPWEDPASFRGFSDQPTASVSATRRAAEAQKVTVVMFLDGAFHAVETDTASIKELRWSVPSDVVVQFVEPPTPPRGAASWKERVTRARRASEYAELLAEATGVPRSKVHILQVASWPPDGEVPADGKPGSLNLAVWDSNVRGRTYPSLLRAERTGALPTPVVVIGSRPFKESLEALRSTVVHEQRHANHLRAVVALIKQWRDSRSRLAFHPWLEGRKDVPDEIRWVALTLVERPVQGGVLQATLAETELFAHLEGLRVALFHMPAADLADIVVGRLIGLAEQYLATRSDAPKQEFRRRLAGDLSKLDVAKRTEFDRAVAKLPESLAATFGERARASWEPFVKELEAMSQRALGGTP